MQNSLISVLRLKARKGGEGTDQIITKMWRTTPLLKMPWRFFLRHYCKNSISASNHCSVRISGQHLRQTFCQVSSQRGCFPSWLNCSILCLRVNFVGTYNPIIPIINFTIFQPSGKYVLKINISMLHTPLILWIAWLAFDNLDFLEPLFYCGNATN